MKLSWLSNIKRINLCLSIILTIFFSNMVSYGLPTFEKSDSLEISLEFYIGHYAIYLHAFYSSIIAFIFHILLILLLRYIE